MRWPAIVLLLATLVIAIIEGFITPTTNQSPLWYVAVGDLFFLVVAGVLAYATAALIVGARRSSDRNLRRSILFLGLAVLTLVLSLVLTFPFSEGIPYAIIYQGSTVIGIYLIYKSVMSLTPIGKIEKKG